METSDYHQHIDHTTIPHRPRPVVVGAPYVLCAFTVGVILMAVGTFITSHAYDEEERDPVLLGVGPGLLGLGGLLLLSAVLICVIACLRNRRFHEYFYDDFFTIGSSTFYGDNRFVHLEDESSMGNAHGHGIHHSASGGPTDSNEAIMILANTVAEHNQRKNSRKFPRNHSYENKAQGCYVGPQGLGHDGRREDPDELGLDPIRRAQRYPELADFGLSESDDYIPRSRFYSMSVRRTKPRISPVEQQLRRNLSYTQASRTRLKQLQRQRQQAGQQLLSPDWEPQNSGPQRKRSSRRKKNQAHKNEVEIPPVHPLPKYDPDLLRALGIETNRPRLDRGISEDGILTSEGAQSATWWQDPDVTHGSLGNRRSRPAVAMGVLGLRPKQSGADYRHSSSVYASDMELQRTDVTATSDTSQAGCEQRDFQSQGGRSPNLPPPGSSMSSRILSSPTLLSPYDHEDASSQSKNMKENTSSPTTSPTPHSRCRRPLSNISSASESCCSECCDSPQKPVESRNSEHDRPHSASQGEADQDSNLKPHNDDRESK